MIGNDGLKFGKVTFEMITTIHVFLCHLFSNALLFIFRVVYIYIVERKNEREGEGEKRGEWCG